MREWILITILGGTGGLLASILAELQHYLLTKRSLVTIVRDTIGGALASFVLETPQLTLGWMGECAVESKVR
jgi:hypothetical protein